MKNQPDEPKKFGCKEIVCSKNCVSKKFWLQKKCCVRIEFGSKIVLGSKNIGTFWVQMILDPKSLGLNKMVVQKNFYTQKIGSKKFGCNWIRYCWNGQMSPGQILNGQMSSWCMAYSNSGQVSPGQIFPWHISLWQLSIVKEKHRSHWSWGDAHLSFGAAQAPPTKMGST